MANNWPDGGETPLTTREMLVMGCVGVGLVSLFVGAVLFGALALMGRPPTLVELVVVVALSLAVGLLWVRPWETEPPRR